MKVNEGLSGHATPLKQTYFHGTKAKLTLGDLITPGMKSNFGARNPAKYVYCTATLDASIWGAELSEGDENDAVIYLVEPTGELEDDPNLTDKKFPGNPSMSYRTKSGLRIVGILNTWQGHSEEQIKSMKNALAKLKAEGVEPIED